MSGEVTGASASDPSAPDTTTDEGFARPYLSSSAPRPPSANRRPGQHNPPAEADAEAVRPYFVTGGRVHDDLGGFETVHILSAQGERHMQELAFERRQIAELCRSPQSVAEISAHLSLPLGVATVLTRDLAKGGFLDTAATGVDPSSDLQLITRLIDALHAL